MSWSDRGLSRRLFVLAAPLAAGLGTAGCFRPLYGEVASGRSMQAELAAIEVVEIPERVGHYLRSELMFLLDGSGEPSPKRYLLRVSPTLAQSIAIVDAQSGRADAATITGSAPFELVAKEGGASIFKATATGTATYDRSAQRFVSVRAARDAEIRLAKLLAEQIRTRVAAALAARG